MIRVTGIFRFCGHIREGGVVGPRLYLGHKVFRVQRCLYRNSSELPAQWEGDHCRAVLSRHCRLIAGGQGRLDNSVGERP